MCRERNHGHDCRAPAHNQRWIFGNNGILVLIIACIGAWTFFSARSHKAIPTPLAVSQWELPLALTNNQLAASSPSSLSPKRTPLVLYYTVVGHKEFMIEQMVPFRGPIDLNTAGVNTLMMIRGIGRNTAQAILDYRRSHDGFKNVSELLRVDGIGQTTYLRLAHMFTVSPQPETTSDE